MLGNIWHIVLALRPHVDPQFINVQPKDWGGIFPQHPVWDIMPKNEKGYIVMSLDTEKMTSFSGCMGESFVDFKIFFFT